MKKANKDTLYLSGVINENQYYSKEEFHPLAVGKSDDSNLALQPLDDEDHEPEMELPEFKQLMRKLSIRIGGKANTYVPLVRYIAKNKNMLPMFEELIEDVAKLQSSIGKRIFQ